MKTLRDSLRSTAALLTFTLVGFGCNGESTPDTESGTETGTSTTGPLTGDTDPLTTTGTETSDPGTSTTEDTTDPTSTTAETTVEPNTTTEDPTSEGPTTETGGSSSTGVETTTGGALSFAVDVYPVAIQGFCSCHDGQGKLNLTTPELAYASFVDVDSGQVDLKIVAPGDAASSYLINKLDGTSGDLGGNATQMPKDNPPLSDEQIATVEQWINDGALP